MWSKGVGSTSLTLGLVDRKPFYIGISALNGRDSLVDLASYQDSIAPPPIMPLCLCAVVVISQRYLESTAARATKSNAPPTNGDQ